MAEALYTEARFHDEDAARAHLEAVRWPSGPVCPHCGGTERNSLLKGKSHRAGLYFCGDCRDPFTVTVGTVFERSKIPLHKWLLAMQLMCSSKKGVSSHQLHRSLGVTYKTAWFMTHRIREAMRVGALAVPHEAGTGDLHKRRQRCARSDRANSSGAVGDPLLQGCLGPLPPDRRLL